MSLFVTIIIPTLLRNTAYLVQCLESVNRQDFKGELKVIVVCNSTSQEMSKHPDLQKYQGKFVWLFLNENQGFTGAVNAGLQHAKGDIVLLNDDTVVERQFLSELLKVHTKTKADMVASNIFSAQTKQIDSQGFSFLWRGKARALNGEDDGWKDKKDYWLNNTDLFPKVPAMSSFWQEPFGPDAAAGFYSQKLLSQTGGLKPEFFAYLEDVELALRARKLGFSCAFAPRAVVYHHKHATSKRFSHFKAQQDLKNWWRIIIFTYPLTVWKRFWRVIILERLRNLSGVLKSWRNGGL